MTNRKILIKLVVATIFILIAMLSIVKLHAWQKDRIAEKALQKALTACDNEQWATAVSNFQKYLAIRGTNSGILRKYAKAQLSRRPLKRQYLNSAIRAYRRILLNEPDNLETASEMLDLLLDNQLPAEAELIIERLYALKTHPRIQLKLAVSKERLGKYYEAANIAAELVAADSSNVSAYDLLVTIASNAPAATAKSTHEWVTLCIHNNPDDPLAHILAAELAARAGDKDKAIQSLQIAKEFCQDSFGVHLRLAKAYLSLQKYNQAMIQLDAAAVIETNSYELWKLYADHALFTGQRRQMENVALRAMECLEPDDWDFMPVAIELLVYAGQNEQAKLMVAEYRKLGGWRTTACFLEGLIYYYQGNTREAIKLWEQAIKLGDTSNITKLKLTEAYINERRPRPARKLLNTFDSKDHDVRWLILSGQASEQLGNDEKAFALLQQAVQLQPDNTVALQLCFERGISMIRSGSVSISKGSVKAVLDLLMKSDIAENSKLLFPLKFDLACGNLEKCQEHIAGIEAKGTDDPELMFLKADLAYMQSDLQEAVKLLDSFGPSHPGFARAALRGAELLVEAGEIELAREFLERKLKAAPTFSRPIIVTKLSDMLDNPEHSRRRYEMLKREHETSGASVSLNRDLLSCAQVADNAPFAQKLIAELRQLEGEAGWRWKIESVRHWLQLPDFASRYPKAVQLLDSVLTAYPDLATAHMLMAQAQELVGRTNLALRYYNLALEQEPSNISIAVEVISAFLRAGRADEAGNLSESYLRKFPDNVTIASVTADHYVNTGNLNQASQILSDLLELRPSDTSLLLRLIDVQIRMGDIASAEVSLITLLDQLPANHNLDSCQAAVKLSLAKGEIDKAVDYCNQLLEHSDAGHKPYLLRARIYALTGRTSEAMTDLLKATRAASTDASVWLELAIFFHSLGEVSASVKAIERCLDLAPYSSDVRRHACRILLASSNDIKRKQGYEILQSLRIIDPYDVSLALLDARSLFAKRTKESAIKADAIIHQLSREDPLNREIWTTWAKALADQHNNERAVQVVSQGLLYLPNDPVLLSLMQQYSMNNKNANSLEDMEAFLHKHPGDAESAVIYAQELIRMGKAESAKTMLEEYMSECTPQVRPKLETWHAIAAYNMGNENVSETEFEGLLSKYAGNPYVLAERFKILARQGRHHEVSEYVKAHVKNDNKQIAIFVGVAKQLAAQKTQNHIPLATLVCEALHEISKNDLTVMSMLGALYKKQGFDRKSLAVYEQIVNLYPDNSEAINNLAWLIAEIEKDYDDALELASSGMGSSENYANLIDTRGVINFRLRHYQAAKMDFTRVLDLADMGGPLYVSSMFHLGRTLAAMDEDEPALNNLQEALELNEYARVLSNSNVKEANRLINLLIGTVDEHEHKNN